MVSVHFETVDLLTEDIEESQREVILWVWSLSVSATCVFFPQLFLMNRQLSSQQEVQKELGKALDGALQDNLEDTVCPVKAHVT